VASCLKRTVAKTNLVLKKLRHQPLAKASYATGRQCPCQQQRQRTDSLTPLKSSDRVMKFLLGASNPQLEDSVIVVHMGSLSHRECALSAVSGETSFHSLGSAGTSNRNLTGRLRPSWRIGSLKFGTTRPPSPAKTITAISLPKCPFGFVVVKGVVATCFISPLSRLFQSPLAVVVILNCAGAKSTEFAVRSSIKITSFILPHLFMVVAVGQRLCPSHRH